MLNWKHEERCCPKPSAFENAQHWGSHHPCSQTSFHKLRLNEQILIPYSHQKIEFLSMTMKQGKELSYNI